MALQASGTIKLSQINTELGRSSSATISLDSAESGTYATINTASASYPADARPAKMSEWYSYDHSASSVTPSTYYWLGDGVNDTIRITGNSYTFFAANNSQDMSFCGWYRIDETSAQVQHLMSASTSTVSGNNQIFIMYHGSLNRLMFRYRHNGSFHQIQKSLHDNLSATGVSSSGWTSTNRGNTNSDGFVHLAFTYDASNRTASNGMKIYWNAQELTTTASSSNVSSPAAWDARSFAIGDLVSSSPNNANVFKGGIDNVSVHGKVLTQSEITSLYNSGTVINCDDAGVDSNILGEYRLENNTENSDGIMSDLSNIGGGTFTTY